MSVHAAYEWKKLKEKRRNEIIQNKKARESTPRADRKPTRQERRRKEHKPSLKGKRGENSPKTKGQGGSDGVKARAKRRI